MHTIIHPAPPLRNPQFEPDGMENILYLMSDILDKMEFTPVISDDLRLMDERLFRPELMKLSLK